MAANTNSAPIGPVPFEDIDGDQASVFQEQPPEEVADVADMVSSLPSKMDVHMPVRIFCYQGVWLSENWLRAAVALQRRFVPRPNDVIIASHQKCGTTWLVALAFATMVRHTHPPTAGSHPLRRLNPHQCLPFLEGLFINSREAILDTLPSPRLINTHMPLSMLPRTTTVAAGGCRVIYICREPKDMVVSWWHYIRRQDPFPNVTFDEIFESFCNGARMYGPFWDHILGYWHTSAARPDSVLFLRYEELLHDPAGNVRKLARFVGLPFSEAEEESGIVHSIVKLCSLDNLRNIEANKTGYMHPVVKIPRDALFRKGVIGDWVNHMTPEMARRLDDIVADKISIAGLTFK